ncbi:hypothetical protein DL98DRAFT_572445 [Cadophora sp. DSE1049]|nr:hypothetical protein DL98DRAFT_572445 [Cadophora sp. DSE1049]
MMIVDVLATPYIDTVEIMLLHVLYHMQLGKGGYAWMLTGIAIRIAEAIGLHRRSPIDLDLGEDQVKRRSQLWWVAYSLDSFNSSTQGRPTAISDLSTDTEAFSVALGDQASEGGKRPSLQLYYWNVTLSQIRNRFCVGLSTYGTMATRLDALSELDSSLLSWRDSIPLDYRPDQENQATGEDYHLVAILHLEYFNLLRSIHWTSLVLVQANKELSATLQHPRIRTSESICLAASRSFIKTLNDIAGHPVQHRIFLLSFLTDHYMAALAVLYRNIFRSPERLSARADLEYFRAGKFHLDRDTNKSELRGDMIDLFDNMLTALEDLLSSHSAEAS